MQKVWKSCIEKRFLFSSPVIFQFCTMFLRSGEYTPTLGKFGSYRVGSIMEIEFKVRSHRHNRVFSDIHKVCPYGKQRMANLPERPPAPVQSGVFGHT